MNKNMKKSFEGIIVDIYTPIHDILNNSKGKEFVYYNISHMTKKASRELGRLKLFD